jgi:phycocyanobilin lyase beta subunit
MSLSQLIQAVEEADSSKKLLEAVKNLANAKLEGAVPTLIEALSYNNPGAAVAAVDGLIALGNPAVPALLELLDMHNYTARSWAIRALAGIGDPRALVTLLGVATADFAFSVRRAAVKGLGLMKWHWFPDELREIAQEEALEALLFVAQQDDEWVVRYAAIVGLQALALTIADTYPEWRSQIQASFAQMANREENLAVRARVWLALQNIQQNAHHNSHTSLEVTTVEARKSPLTSDDWQDILNQLYDIKRQERAENLKEGDPRRFQKLAAAINQNNN